MSTYVREGGVLQGTIYDKISEYLTINSEAFKGNALYSYFLEQVEPPLLEAVMAKTRFNQVQAAKMLGLSRGTLRKKLKQHFDDKYVGSRGDDIV